MQITQNKEKVLQSTKDTDTKQKQSMWSKLINGIVRPPRANYRQAQLGTKFFVLNEVKYERKEVSVKHEGKIIQLTLFEPQFQNKWVVLYLHGNSSSKLESISVLKKIPHKFSLAAFDFMGCGKNTEEDVITLGKRESKQAETVANYLKSKGLRIIIWGRSMGAASALIYGKAEVIVADSSFKSMKSLCKQVAKSGAEQMFPKFPHCLVSCFFPCVFSKLRADVQKKGDYNLQELDVTQAVKRIDPQTLMIFLSGNQDALIHHRNSQKLYNLFPGKNKHLQIFKGGHNTKRPEEVIDKVMAIIQKHTKQLPQKASPKQFQTSNAQLEMTTRIG